jgi:hypothetical protein
MHIIFLFAKGCFRNILKPQHVYILCLKPGKPELKWLESVEEGLKDMGVSNWRRNLQVREEWREILEESKIRKGL